MSEILKHYVVGTAFALIAMLLIYAGQPVVFLIPAGAAVYILGCLLLDVWRDRG